MPARRVRTKQGAAAFDAQIAHDHAARYGPDGAEPSGPAVRREWDWGSALVVTHVGSNGGSNRRVTSGSLAMSGPLTHVTRSTYHDMPE